ncbi:MAG: acyl-CoA dehydrogenase, partial [Planctomycetes bacterium]|nr:acyl-CoA dehydrogenase [Planctomycetota bacterium]
MGNFYTDNDDIRFLFRHLDLARLAEAFEEGFRFRKEFDYAPGDEAEAVRNYEMVLEALGELCADFIAPRAESVDRTGNQLNEDGTVARPEGIREAIEKLGQAEVMGFTLPHR